MNKLLPTPALNWFFAGLIWLASYGDGMTQSSSKPGLLKIQVTEDGRGFVTEAGQPFVPLGVNYFRPGTGWAPQVWKQFDAEATRRDFARLKKMGANCVRVFLTYGSFYQEAGKLHPAGLAKFDQFLGLAEEAGLYVHPTGPDHWEGLPAWARGDRIAEEIVLGALENFWRQLAARYQGRNVIFAYDLLNEPAVGWGSQAMVEKWHQWLKRKYRTESILMKAWDLNSISRDSPLDFGGIPAPPDKDAPGDRRLLDFQEFRETIADDWTRRQVAAIKTADPKALVTVGLIQWSVPALLPGARHYSAFKPQRQAAFLDFMEVHFYPLARGFYEYASAEDENRNLAYLESVVSTVARCGKPVVVAEFGWYGGGKLTINQGRHPEASEEKQARWCRRLIEITATMASGWLNWGFHDHPESGDVTQLTGLLKADGSDKAWARTFQELAAQFREKGIPPLHLPKRPTINWAACVTSAEARRHYLEAYFEAFKPSPDSAQ